MDKGKGKAVLEEVGDHLYIKAFLLDSSVNLNAWGVSPVTLDKNISSFISRPIVITEDFGHPQSNDPNFEHHLNYQDQFRIGTIIDITNKDGIYSAIAEITNKDAKEAFRQGNLPLYVSPQIFHDGFGKEPDDAAVTWRGTHLAIVNEPAFTVKKARISGQCNGSGETCVAQLKKASCNFCIKRTIQNYVTNNVKKVSSLHSDKSIKSSKLSEVKEETQTVSIEEHNKVKQALEESQAQVASLTKVNETVSSENKTVTDELNKLQSEYRKDKVASMHEGCYFKNDEDKNESIESFTKSGMTYEQINKHLDQLRHIKSASVQTETKLPQKNAATEDSNGSEKLSSYLSLRTLQFGGSA